MATKTDHGFDASKHPRAADGRFGSVSGQHAGHGRRRTVTVTTSGPVSSAERDTVQAAIDLLPDAFADVEAVHLVAIGDPRREADLRRAQNATEGYIEPGGTRINIPTYSKTFLEAAKGHRAALIRLASVIAHEQVHLHGGDERQAYDRQLEVLRLLGAPGSVIRSVQESRSQVVGSRFSEVNMAWIVDPTAAPSRCSTCGCPLTYRGYLQECTGCDVTVDLRDAPTACAERTALAERASEQRERSRWRELRHRFLAELRGGTSRDDDDDDQRDPSPGSRFVWDESIFLQGDDRRARLIAESTSKPGDPVDAETLDQLRGRK